MEDADFLSATFKGADVAYLMEALGSGSFFDQNFDIMAAHSKIANNYAQAILQSGIKRVVPSRNIH